MAAVTVCSDFVVQEIKSVTVSTVSLSIYHEMMRPDVLILVFEFWVLSQLFHCLSPSSRGSIIHTLTHPQTAINSVAILASFIIFLSEMYSFDLSSWLKLFSLCCRNRISSGSKNNCFFPPYWNCKPIVWEMFFSYSWMRFRPGVGVGGNPFQFTFWAIESFSSLFYSSINGLGSITFQAWDI